jgi:UDP-3-O-[3-hydroxymyristoyl] glucosamine N-acyltransferase
MALGVIGRGKISFLVEDILEGREDLVFYDDSKEGLEKTDACAERRLTITIGNTEIRRRLFEHYRDREIESIVSPKAHISFSAEIGRGAIISHHCAIHAHAKIGESGFIYSNAVIDVYAVVGAFCRIGPHVYIGENARIGNNTIINAGAQIAPGITIGNNVHVAAGALVTRSFGDFENVVGSPARSLRGEFVHRN